MSATTELPDDALEMLDGFGVVSLGEPHESGFTVAIQVAADSGVRVTEAPGGYLFSAIPIEGAVLWIDETAAPADRDFGEAYALWQEHAEPAPSPRALEGVLMRAARASELGFPRMNAIVLGALRQPDPWVVLVGSTDADAVARSGRRRLPSARARLAALDAEMLRPRPPSTDPLSPSRAQSSGTDSLASWAAARGVEEAYRVVREPSSHGGTIGWRVTVWRADGAWRRDVATLDFFAPGAEPPIGAGSPMTSREIEAVRAAIEASAFWEETTEHDRRGLDGYTVFFEGVRAGASRERSAWCPTEDEMFRAFAAIAAPPPRKGLRALGCLLALALLAAAIAHAIGAQTP